MSSHSAGTAADAAPVASTTSKPPAPASLCRLCQKSGSMDITDATVELPTTGESVQLRDAYRSFASLASSAPAAGFEPTDALRICFGCTNELVAAYTFLAKVLAAEERLGPLVRVQKQQQEPQAEQEEANDHLDIVVKEEYSLQGEQRPQSGKAVADNTTTTKQQPIEEAQPAGAEQHEESVSDAERGSCEIIEITEVESDHDNNVDDIDDDDFNLSAEYIDIDDDFEEATGTEPETEPLPTSPTPSEAPAKRQQTPNRKRPIITTSSPPSKQSPPERTAKRARRKKGAKETVDLNNLYLPLFIITDLDTTTRPDLHQPSTTATPASLETPTTPPTSSKNPNQKTTENPTAAAAARPSFVAKTLHVYARRVGRRFREAVAGITETPANMAEHTAVADAAAATAGSPIVFVCTYCTKAFSTAAHLMLHTRKNHVCQFCVGTFQQAPELHRHLRVAHRRQHCCALCERDFVGNSALRYHLRAVHGVQMPGSWSLLALRDLEPSVERIDDAYADGGGMEEEEEESRRGDDDDDAVVVVEM